MGNLTHTVSGEIASFRSATHAPIESLKYHFKPKQSFNGYDKPWPAGGGKNLLNINANNKIGNSKFMTYTTETTTGFNIGNSDVNGGYIVQVSPNTTYTYSYTSTYNGASMHGRVWESANPITDWNTDNYTLSVNTTHWTGSETFTTGNDTNWLIIGIYAYGDGKNSSITNIQLEKGSSATSWVPYSNICPIEGWTDCTTYNTGKNIGHIIGYSAASMNSPTATKNLTNAYGTEINTTNFLLPDTSLTITQSQTEYWESTTPSSYRNGYFCIGFDNLIFNEYYDFSFKITNITSNPLNQAITNIKLYTPSGTQKSYSALKDDNILIFRNVKWTPHPTSPNRCTLDVRNLGMSFTISEIMVTPVNKSDGVFEPYEGSVFPITFPDGETIYGGYYDPVAGEIVAEYEMIEDLWGNWPNLSDQGDGTELRYKRFNNPVYGNGITNHNTDYCNVAKYVYTNNNGNPHYYIVGGSYNCRVYLPSGYNTTQNVQVIGKLITPIHIPVAPQDLQAFLDHNNFWSDANDITEVTYKIGESKDIIALKEKAADFNNYFQGELVFELNGDDAPIDGKWIERVNGWEFILLGDTLYDTTNKVYDFSGRSLACTETKNTDKLSMGHHFRIEWDLYYKRKLCNSSIFFDICSLTSADKAIGIGLLTKNDNSTISFNWKLNGNSSNPWTGGSEQRISPVTIPMDDNFTHFTGFHEIIPGNDGYDRLRVKINDRIIKYTTPVPKADYTGPWLSSHRNISVGAGVYNIDALQRNSTGDNSYYCECKIKSIKIYKYD